MVVFRGVAEGLVGCDLEKWMQVSEFTMRKIYDLDEYRL
jgi:hypothetical protein